MKVIFQIFLINNIVGVSNNLESNVNGNDNTKESGVERTWHGSKSGAMEEHLSTLLNEDLKPGAANVDGSNPDTESEDTELAINNATRSELDVADTGKKVCTNDTALLWKLLKEGNYNPFAIPNENGVEVNVSYWIQEMTSVSELKADFILDIYVNEVWIDYNLAYARFRPCKEFLTLTESEFQGMWKPSACFVNSKSSNLHDSPSSNVFVIIYPNGKVWYNYRIKLKGPCNIDLSLFPMDTQTCSLRYMSYNYNKDQVRLKWLSVDPIILLRDIVLPEKNLIKWNTYTHFPTKAAGHWVELTVQFEFKRRNNWFFFQLYVPTYLVIFISWISFSLDTKDIPSRTCLGVSSILFLVMRYGNITRSLPRVSYMKAIDVWIFGCMVFVFSSLIELAVVAFLNESNFTTMSKKTTVSNPTKDSTIPSRLRNFKADNLYESFDEYLIAIGRGPVQHKQAKDTSGLFGYIRGHVKIKSERIDYVCATVFPTLFSIFNIVYWAFYSMHSDSVFRRTDVEKQQL